MVGKVALERSAVVFDQRDANVGLCGGGKQSLVLALGCGNRFIGPGDVFFESDGVRKLAFSFALEFLKAREIAFGRGEMPFRGGQLDGGIFARFGDCFDTAERFQVGERCVEFI